MRSTLAIVVAASGGLLLMFTLLPEDPTAPRRDLLRQEPEGAPGPARAARGEPIDIRGARGSDVFSPQQRTTTLADGTRLTWTSLLLWCRRFSEEEEDRFLFEDVRIVRNPDPETAADLEHHVAVPPDVPASEIGGHLLEAMGGHASGIRARRAVFIGGRDLDAAHRVELTEQVTVWLVDPADPDRTALLRCASLVLELDDGRVVRAVTDARVHVAAEGYGSLEATGLVYVPESGVLTLKTAITGELEDLRLLGRSATPARLRAAGPLVWTPQEPPAADPEELVARGRLVVERDIVVTQGERVIRGGRLVLATQRRDGIRVRSFRLEGAVSATTPEGTFHGERVAYTAGDVPGEARLVLEGAPVRAVLEDAVRALPGLGSRGPLHVTADGTVVFDHLDAAGDAVREITIGPGVTLTAEDARVTARTLRLGLHRVPENRAGAAPGARVTRPASLVLEGAVSGEGPRGSFSGERLHYERRHGPDGRPTSDRIALTGPAELVHRRLAVRGGGGRLEPAAREDAVLGGAGPLHIAAGDAITVVRDPLRQEPLRAEAHGQVVIRRLEPGGADAGERARLEAGTVELRVRETWTPDLDGGVTLRFLSDRDLEHAVARGAVAVHVRDRFRGAGDALTWDRTRRELVLTSEGGTAAATVTLTDAGARDQVVSAPRITYREGSRAVAACGGVRADLLVPPVAHGPGVDPAPVPTRVAAQTVTAWLADAGVEEGGPAPRRVREVLAEGDVVARQGERARITCALLRLDTRRPETIIQGDPARLDLERREGGGSHPEWIVAPSGVFTGGEGLLEGPVSVRVHARPGRLAIDLATTAERGPVDPAAPSPAPLVPVDITAARDLYVSRERIQARGRATVEQGDPAAGGFRLEGDRIVLFLVEAARDPDAPDGGDLLDTLEVARAVCEGTVRFTSEDLAGRGDVMEFDDGEDVISLWRHEGNATLTWRGRQRLPRPRFDLDLADPDNPVLISVLEPPPQGDR